MHFIQRRTFSNFIKLSLLISGINQATMQSYCSFFTFMTYFFFIKFQKQPPEVFCKKGVLRNLTTFTGKHLCQSLFFDKVAGPCNFLKKETLAQVFSCEFCQISKNSFFTEHLWATASKICLFINYIQVYFFKRFSIEAQCSFYLETRHKCKSNYWFLSQMQQKQQSADLLQNRCS